MAEVTGLRNNSTPFPIYGAPWGIIAPLLDADGDLVTGATTPDSEVSKNGDTFADCTNEMVEIATNSGVYYLLLTATEMTADVVSVIMKSATAGMKTTTVTLYPRKLVTIRSGTSASAGSATSTIVLDASASAIDDFYNGMVCIATIDGNVEARVISDYTGSTQTATVVPDWNVAPDNNDTFVIKLPEGPQLHQANVTHISERAASASGTVTFPNATLASTTNITAGTITTVTNLTNAPTNGDLTATMKTSVTTAATAATPIAASVAGAVGSVTGNVTGSVGSLATQAKADVNAEVVDALATDTYAEPGQGAPSATTSLAAKINYLYKAFRNKKTQSTTEFKLYNDAETVVDQKVTLSDDGSVLTSGEVATGP